MRTKPKKFIIKYTASREAANLMMLLTYASTMASDQLMQRWDSQGGQSCHWIINNMSIDVCCMMMLIHQNKTFVLCSPSPVTGM